MCGIIGITSNKPVSSSIINSLKKLEYRGYDSAGIATILDGSINEVKCEGRVKTLENNISKIVSKGVKEVILTGGNIGDYGKGEFGNKKYNNTFFDVINELDNSNGIKRFRISSIDL